MHDTYRVVAAVDYHPSLGMIEHVDTERRLVRLLNRVRSELSRFTVPVGQPEFDDVDLMAKTIKATMMGLVKSKGVEIRQPDLTNLELLLKDLRNDYRRWNFKSAYDSGQSSDEWIYQQIEPYKELYEEYIETGADVNTLIEFMADILAGDYAKHIVKELSHALNLFTRLHTHKAKKGSPFEISVLVDTPLGGGGQVYTLIIKLRE